MKKTTTRISKSKGQSNGAKLDEIIELLGMLLMAIDKPSVQPIGVQPYQPSFPQPYTNGYRCGSCGVWVNGYHICNATLC